MRTWFLAVLALPFSAAFLVSPALAQTAQRSLTLTEALSLARQNNRDLQAARARVLGAEASIEQARAALLPTVAAQGKYTHNIPEVIVTLPPATPGGDARESAITPANQLDAVLTANVPLVVPSAYSAYAAAQKNRQASEADLRVTETRLLFTSAQVFFAAAGTDELVTARHHAVEVAEQTLRNAQTRFEAGTATKVETSRAQLAVIRAQQAEREALEQQANVYAQLATLIRLPGSFRVQAPTPEDVGAHAADAPESLVSQAYTLRPEFNAYQMRLEALSANIDSMQYRWAPTLSAFGNARAFNYTAFAGRHTAFAFGVQLDWVIFDGGVRDAQRHALETQLLDTKLQFEQARSTVADDVRQSRRAIDTKRYALEAAQAAVGLSQETLELVRAQYEAGTALQIDLLAAQDNLIGAEVGLAQARFDLALADLTLQRNAGTFANATGGDTP
jgi:outer membrane protein TolC